MPSRRVLGLLFILAVSVAILAYTISKKASDPESVTVTDKAALTVYEKFPTSYVEDNAHILGAFTHHLDRTAKIWRDNLGIDVRVITLKSSNSDINVLAHTLFQEKEIGKTTSNGGILLLIDAENRNARIEVSYSLEDLFTDALTGRLARSQLAPYASYQIVGMAVMDVLRYLYDSALEQAVYGNFNLPEQFANSEAFQVRQLLYSGGGGAKTAIPAIPMDEDLKKNVPESKLALYAPSSSPKETIEAYKRSLTDYIGYAELSLFTEGSQEMRRRYPFAPYEAVADLRGILAAEPLTIYTQGEHAVALPDTPVSGYRPILMKRTNDVWQIHIVETMKNLFFIGGGKYQLQNVNTPYAFALKRLGGPQSQENIAAIPLSEGDLKKTITSLEDRSDALSRFMLAELLFRNAFAAIDALVYYEEAVKAAPADPLILSTFLQRALYLGFPELALPYIKNIDRSNGLLLARVYTYMNRHDLVEQLMRQLLDRNPYYREALVWLSKSQAEQGKTNEAEETDRRIEKLDSDPKRPSNPVVLDFVPAAPWYHAKNTTMVGATKVYGFSEFLTGMTNTSNRPVQIESVVLTSAGTGNPSGLGDIKGYWRYNDDNRVLQPGERLVFNKTWGFTTNPGHQRLSYIFDICWHAVGGRERQCNPQRLDLVSELTVLALGGAGATLEAATVRSGMAMQQVRTAMPPLAVLAQKAIDEMATAYPDIRKSSPTYQRVTNYKQLAEHILAGRYNDVNLLLEPIYKQSLNGPGIPLFTQYVWAIDDYLPVNRSLSDLITHLQEWVEQAPDNPIARTLLGYAYYKYAWEVRGNGFSSETSRAQFEGMKSRLAICLMHIRKALALDKGNIAAWDNYIRASFMSKGREAGEKAMKEAIESQPHSLMVHYAYLQNLATKWFGRSGEDLAYVLNLAEKAPKDSLLPLLVAEGYYQDSNRAEDERAYFQDPRIWKDFKKYIEPLMQTYPDLPLVFLTYAELAELAGHLDIAEEYYKKSVAIDQLANKARVGGTRGLAETYDKMRRFDDALKYYRMEAAFSLKDRYIWEKLIQLTDYTGDAEKSMLYAAYAVENIARTPYSLSYLCKSIAAHYDFNDALRYCNEAIEKQPNYSVPYEIRADLYEKMGRYEDSRRDRDRYNKLNPEQR